jgi:hypothetical protein
MTPERPIEFELEIEPQENFPELPPALIRQDATEN